MEKLKDNDIPYSFIRIGEEVNDIEFKQNYTEDMPSEIESFEPVVDVNDDECGSYEDVVIDTKSTETKDESSHIIKDHIKDVLFNLFEKYSDRDEVIHALISMNRDGKISDAEYHLAIKHWNEYLDEWTATRVKLD